MYDYLMLIILAECIDIAEKNLKISTIAIFFVE